MEKILKVFILALMAVVAVVALSFGLRAASTEIRAKRVEANELTETSCFEYRQTYLMLLCVRHEMGSYGTQYECQFRAICNSLAAASNDADLDTVIERTTKMGLNIYDPVDKIFVGINSNKYNVKLSDVDKLRMELRYSYDVTLMDQQVVWLKHTFLRNMNAYTEKNKDDKGAAERFRNSVLNTGMYHLNEVDDYAKQYWN